MVKTQKRAMRFDQDKVELHYLPVEPLRQIARVYMFGARKYGPANWRKGMLWSKCYNSAMRHILAFWEGQDMDEEAGLSHLAHAAWNIITLIVYSYTHPELDDRYKPEVQDVRPGTSKNGRSKKRSTNKRSVHKNNRSFNQRKTTDSRRAI